MADASKESAVVTLEVPLLTTCGICYNPEHLANLPCCEHSFCEHCIKLYLEHQILYERKCELNCLSSDCAGDLPYDFFCRFLDTSVALKFEKNLKTADLERDPATVWCPQPDCDGYDLKRPDSTWLSCNECNFAYCYKCHEEWHGATKCCKNRETLFLRWVAQHNVKFCPLCRRKVEKSGGCQHMTCPKCRTHWCWNCGELMDETHRPLNCQVGPHWYNLYWYVPLALLFGPLVAPFVLLLVVAYCVERDQLVYAGAGRWTAILTTWRTLFYLLLFLLSPWIELLLLVFAGFVLGFAVVGSFQYILRNWGCFLLGMVLGLALGAVLDVFLVAAAGLAICLSPVVGLVLLGAKLVFLCKGGKRSAERPKYPRSLV